ncbi:hypothetical protein [Chitiniphilus eburneus]|uniref:Uncharacterized protein n=1 Tax=Chitiniphilus eburneus TaxID=2571148 RepID=A0A4U0Q7U3_9NEIS|nr:hypothetical protein [Chitiniphilus eburneus]TJZ77321.1 hypothetical protein FAZ21_02965 [Chitiniphilus eburneus]
MSNGVFILNAVEKFKNGESVDLLLTPHEASHFVKLIGKMDLAQVVFIENKPPKGFLNGLFLIIFLSIGKESLIDLATAIYERRESTVAVLRKSQGSYCLEVTHTNKFK